MKRSIIIILNLLFPITCALAQEPDIPQVFSPNAAELGKYGKVPVSYFSGLPQISIPLIPLKTKSGDLDISLSYHAGGNKPDIHPGWTGLSWTLHAGGCINRIINGAKDEIDEYESGYTTDNYGYLYHSQTYQTADYDNQQLMESYYDAAGVIVEGRPDEFQVNLPGIQASFYVTSFNKQTGGCAVNIQSRDPVHFHVDRIEVVKSGPDAHIQIYDSQTFTNQCEIYSYIKSIQLTDAMGNIYLFGDDDSAIEFTYSPRHVSQWSAVATASTWHLKEIQRPDGEIITFTYKKDGVPVVVSDIHSGFSAGGQNLGAFSNSTRDNPWERRNINFTLLKPSYLTRITGSISRDTVLFHSSRSNELGYSYSDYDLNVRLGGGEDADWNAVGWSEEGFRTHDYYLKLDSLTSRRGSVHFAY